MFFKRKAEEDARPARRPAAAVARREPSPLSPRFARLVRESWWLVIVAGLVWLALILATYTRTDRAWSFSGTGAADRQQGRRRGRVAVRPPALPVRLLGVVVGRRRHRAGRGRLSPPRSGPAGSRAAALSRRPRLPARAAVERGARVAALLSAAGGAAAGGRRGDRGSPRREPRARRRLQRRDAAAARGLRGGLVAVLRHVVAEADGAHRRRRRARARVAPAPLRRARRSPARRAGAHRARGGRGAGQVRGAGTRADPRRAGAAGGAEVGAPGQGDGSGRCSASCPIRRCRRSTCSRRRRRRRTRSAPRRSSTRRA